MRPTRLLQRASTLVVVASALFATFGVFLVKPPSTVPAPQEKGRLGNRRRGGCLALRPSSASERDFEGARSCTLSLRESETLSDEVRVFRPGCPRRPSLNMEHVREMAFLEQHPEGSQAVPESQHGSIWP